MQRAHSLVDVLLVDDAGDLDGRGADHVQVDAEVGQRLEHLGGDAGVAAHTGADQADLGDLRVGVVLSCAELLDDLLERLVGGGDVLDRDRARDVAVAALAGVLDDGVDVDVGVGQRGEDASRDARPVGDSAQRDLGLVGGVADGPDDGLFQLLFDVHSVASVGDPGALDVREAGAHVDGDVVLARVLDRAQGEHLRAAGGHLEHLVVGDGVQLARLRHEARVGGVDAVDVRVDLADRRRECVRQRHGGRVGTAAAERGDVLLGRDALETGDEDDLAVVHGLLDARRVDVEDARLHVHRIGDDAGLRAREAHGVVAEAVDGHGQQGAADAFAGGEEHVHLAFGRVGSDLAGELEELVGGVASGAHDGADTVALLERGDDAARHVADAGGVGDRRPTILLDDDRQG